MYTIFAVSLFLVILSVNGLLIIKSKSKRIFLFFHQINGIVAKDTEGSRVCIPIAILLIALIIVSSLKMHIINF